MTTKEVVRDSKIAAIHKLRVNVKSLAAEARLIKFEENRAGIQYYNELYRHRIDRVRVEARYANLALSLLKGRTYVQVENNCQDHLLHRRVSAEYLARKLWRSGGVASSEDAIKVVYAWLGTQCKA